MASFILVSTSFSTITKIKEAIYDIAYEISLKYDVVLDVSVYSRAEWDRYRGIHSFIINVEKEGVVI